MEERPISERLLWGNILFLVGTPLFVLVATPIYIAQNGLSWAQVITFFVLWWATGLSITAGYHRLFSHRAYKASGPVRLFYAIFGSAACENSVITWCAAHRFHHRDVDTDGDPYNAKRGFAWSHMGWILVEGPRHDEVHNVRDLWADPVCRWQHKYNGLITVAVNIGIPLLVGAFAGDLWGMVLIAGLTRIVMVQHSTFCVNSVAHMFGTQPWSDANTSRDSWLLSFFTFGEGYHNYHHAFQRDYRNGPRWYNYDPTKWLIWFMARFGLTHALTRTPRDVILRRRYEEERARLSDWREGVGARCEALADRLRDEHEAVLTSLGEQVEEAQRRLDAALEELTTTRKDWARAARARRKEISAASRAEIRELRRSVRRRGRAAQRLLAEWQESTAALAAAFEPLPA